MKCLLSFLLTLLLLACGGRGPQPAAEGYRYATLVPDKAPVVGEGPCAVDASVYRGLMEMLGVGERCLDFSDEWTPDVERVIASRPSLLLLSAHEGADVERFHRVGISVVECRDFFEPTPLGRAEWMRFFGRLWGVGERADSLFAEVEAAYLAQRAGQAEAGPRVLFDLVYQGQWYQPTAASSIGQMVLDAGGRLPFAHGSGTKACSVEQVLAEAGQADIWIIRYAASSPLTLGELQGLHPAYGQIHALCNGRIYGCNTQITPYFEETPFRPDWLLSDFKAIIAGSENLKYFHQLQ